MRLTWLSALLSPPPTKKSSWTFFAAGCLCFASLWSNLRWDACKPVPSIRFTGDMDALVTVCSWNTNEIMLWAWMLWSPYALGTRTRLCFGHGCAGHRMLLEHERYYDLGMDALVIVCSRNTNVIMIRAWMLCMVIVCSRNTNGIMIWANVMRGIRSISGPPNRKTRCVAYAVFRGLQTEKRDAWYTQYFGPSKHFERVVRATQVTSEEVGQVCFFWRVYAPAEPITIVMVNIRIIVVKLTHNNKLITVTSEIPRTPPACVSTTSSTVMRAVSAISSSQAPITSQCF